MVDMDSSGGVPELRRAGGQERNVLSALPDKAEIGSVHHGKTGPFSIRLTPEMYARVMAIIGATEGAISKTGLIERALETYIALLQINPSMLEDYDSSKDKSVTQKDRQEHMQAGL